MEFMQQSNTENEHSVKKILLEGLQNPLCCISSDYIQGNCMTFIWRTGSPAKILENIEVDDNLYSFEK